MKVLLKRDQKIIIGHLATYDKDQKTADNIESKIDKIEIGKDGDYTEYLASLKDTPSMPRPKNNRIL